MPNTIQFTRVARKVLNAQKTQLIIHPTYTNHLSLRLRFMNQIIASVKGAAVIRANKHMPDVLAFNGTELERQRVQELVNVHVVSFWQRVETLYQCYLEEHDLLAIA